MFVKSIQHTILYYVPISTVTVHLSSFLVHFNHCICDGFNCTIAEVYQLYIVQTQLHNTPVTSERRWHGAARRRLYTLCRFTPCAHMHAFTKTIWRPLGTLTRCFFMSPRRAMMYVPRFCPES